jgi:hypothetical protein
MVGWQKTCGRTCAARGRINRMGRIHKNVQGMESALYRTLNAKTPRNLDSTWRKSQKSGGPKAGAAPVKDYNACYS